MTILKALPERLLLGPGPSNAHPSVLEAMSLPLIGHLDPEFIALLDRVKEGLRTAFGTQNGMTLPISATGSAGMEAALINLLEPGDCLGNVNEILSSRITDRIAIRWTPHRQDHQAHDQQAENGGNSTGLDTVCYGNGSVCGDPNFNPQDEQKGNAGRNRDRGGGGGGGNRRRR